MAEVTVELTDIDIEEGRRTVVLDLYRTPLSPESPSQARPDAPRAESSALGEAPVSLPDYLASVARTVPKLPALNIALRDFSYVVDVPKSDKRRYEIPGFFSGLRDNLTSSCCVPKRRLDVLRGVDLFLESGKSYLLMGPPGCGTSSLLKALNGRLPRSRTSGQLECNGRELSSYHWMHLSSYCGQLDVHHHLLTVDEIFQFAVDCLYGPRNWSKSVGGEGTSGAPLLPDMDSYLRAKVSAFTYLLGLTNCRDTIIGNESIRGCSGGERKRVSIGESILGPSRVFLMDKISTGLDSAVTFDIANFLTGWTRTLGGILVCHLTQPDPAVIDLFDGVIVMDGGRAIFNGPPSSILPHFRSFSYDLPEGRDFGSFISEMGKSGGREDYRTDPSLPPMSTDEFVAAYKKTPSYESALCRFESRAGVVGLSSASSAVGKAGTREAAAAAVYERRLFEDSYAHSFLYALYVLCRRQFRLTMRNRSYMLARMLNNFVVSLILGWIFLNPSSYIVRMGMITQLMLTAVINGNSAVMTMYKQKNVMYKQTKQRFFGLAQFVVSMNLSDYQLILMDTLIFGTIMYAMGGMTWEDNGTRYLMFLATVFVLLCSYNAYVKMFAFLIRNLSTLQACFPFFMFMMNTFSGYPITVNKILKPLLLFYYISPLNYGLRILASNEFCSPKYIAPYPGRNLTTGQMYLSQYELPQTDAYNGYYILVLLGEHVLFSLLQLLILWFVYFEPYAAGVSVEAKKLPVITLEEQEAKLSRASTSVHELPFQRASFAFENVNYFVNVVDRKTKARREKQLLSDVSGFVRPCSMTALMGASGAGKTTLLDVLSRRKTQGRIEGRFLINGSPFSLNELCRISGYVEQDDTLPSTETVREALLFSARLRIGGSVKEATIEKFVDDMIDLLELREYRGLMIGRPGSGLPVGIRKLVMVGIELVANPSILFLDEPTTGLDSYGAMLVCRVLERIAATGRSIICTIHQPSTEVFGIFREILLLERGGRVVYFGESRGGARMVEYFSGFDGIKPYDGDSNPATWMLDVIGAGVSSRNQQTEFHARYCKSELFETTIRELRTLAEDRSNPITQGQGYASSLWRQCMVLTGRTFRMAYRRTDYNLKRYQIAFLMALILGLIFFQVDGNDQASAQSKFGAIFVSTLFLGLNNIFGNIPVLIDNRLTFYREVSMRTYSSLAQLFALTVMELVYTTIMTTMFQLISYWLIGMQADFGRFMFHVLINVLWILFCVYCGQLTAYIVPTVEVGALVGNIVLLIWNVIAGFMIPYPNLRYPWKAIYWVDPTMFVTQAVLANQFENDYRMVYNVPIEGVLRNFTAREYYEVVAGVRYAQKWWDVFALVVFILFFRLLMAVAMAYVRYISR